MEAKTTWQCVPIDDSAERVEPIMADTGRPTRRIVTAVKTLQKKCGKFRTRGRTALPPGVTPTLASTTSTPHFSLLSLQDGLLKDLAVHYKKAALVSDSYALAGAIFTLAALTKNRFRLGVGNPPAGHVSIAPYILLVGPPRTARKSTLMQGLVQNVLMDVTGHPYIDECTGEAIHEELFRASYKTLTLYYDEAQTLFGNKPAYAAQLDSLITKLYNGQFWTRSLKSNARKTGDSTLRTIENFQVNLCACSTPPWLFKHVSRESFLSGFLLRFMTIYAHVDDPAVLLDVEDEHARREFLQGLPEVDPVRLQDRLRLFHEIIQTQMNQVKFIPSPAAARMLSSFGEECRAMRDKDEMGAAIFSGVVENIRRVAALIEISHLLEDFTIPRRQYLEIGESAMKDALSFFRHIYPDTLRMVKEHFCDSRLEGDSKTLLKEILSLRPKMKRYEDDGRRFKGLTKTEITRHTRLTGNTREAALRELVARDIVDGPITLPSPNRRARKPLQVYEVKRSRWDAPPTGPSGSAMEDEAPGRSSSLPPPPQGVPKAVSSPTRRVKASDCWETPQCLFDALNKEFRFTLDVCASQKNAKCGEYFTVADDGLRQSWEEHSCWCNPPYSDPMPWVKKAVEAIKMGATVVMLVRDDCSTAWFDLARQHACEIRHLQGRLRFDHPAGESAKPGRATFASVLFIFRPDVVPKPQGPIHSYLDYRGLEAAPITCK